MDKVQAMKLMAESHRETVEELEEEINHLKDVIKGNKVIVDIASDELKVLVRQNKRYREAILKVVGADNLSPYQKRSLNEGLEGDPHD